MKVKDLIKELQKMPQDLEVFGVSDHGQQPERVCSPSVCYTEDLEYIEDGWCDDKDDADYNEYKKAFVLL